MSLPLQKLWPWQWQWWRWPSNCWRPCIQHALPRACSIAFYMPLPGMPGGRACNKERFGYPGILFDGRPCCWLEMERGHAVYRERNINKTLQLFDLDSEPELSWRRCIKLQGERWGSPMWRRFWIQIPSQTTVSKPWNACSSLDEVGAIKSIGFLLGGGSL